MGLMNYVYKFLGFETSENITKKAGKRKTKASYKLRNGKAVDRIEAIDGVPVYYPENVEQTKGFLEFVKSDKAIIICTDLCNGETEQKILNLLQGFSLGTGAKNVVLDKNRLYLVLPEEMEIEE